MLHRVLPMGLVALIGLASIACGPVDSPDAPTPEPELGPGKAELFGDPLQLPTRAGERARRELALAGELERALVELELRVGHIDVRLAEGDDPGAVVVLVESPREDPSLPATIRELAAAMVPGVSQAEVHLVVGPEPAPRSASQPAPEAKPGAPLWAMLLAALGLGLSLGVSIERARGLRR